MDELRRPETYRVVCSIADRGSVMIKVACKQRGVSLSGLLVWIVILIAIGIMAMKLVPAYVQDAAISSPAPKQ